MSDEIQVGDFVLVSGNNLLRRDQICKVTKVTATGLFDAGGQRFNKFGTLRGAGTWSRTSARKATQNDIERVRLDRAADFIKHNRHREHPNLLEAAKLLGFGAKG